MVEKESSFEKIKRLSKSLKNIRNIATSAHIHHGKCIGGKSRLLLADGSLKNAKEIFEEISKGGIVKEENEDHTIFIPNRKIEIFSLNKETNRLEKKPIQYAWRLKGGNTIKVCLRNRFEITTTPEHRYVISREGNFEDVEAKDLKLGDRIVCARKLETESKLDIKRAILEKLSQNNFYVNLDKEFSEKLNKKILEYGINNLRLSIKPKSFYHGIWQNRYNLKDILELCKIFDP